MGTTQQPTLQPADSAVIVFGQIVTKGRSAESGESHSRIHAILPTWRFGSADAVSSSGSVCDARELSAQR
ncbi:hypothetical protein [Paenibacillus shenyangensis]|uniref:hypothetical protein n=1 Tax=Paenibacillus sp. A9 TaxID=1284352 RepID=UPI00037E1871|nr:hypothetical protein [Paenibacillus sp. A9]